MRTFEGCLMLIEVEGIQGETGYFLAAMEVPIKARLSQVNRIHTLI